MNLFKPFFAAAMVLSFCSGCASIAHKKNTPPSPVAIFLEKAASHNAQILETISNDAHYREMVPANWISSQLYLTAPEGLQRRVVDALGETLPQTRSVADAVLALPLNGDAKYRTNYERFSDVLNEYGERDKTPSERSSIKRFVESIVALENSKDFEDIIELRVRHWAKVSTDFPREISAFKLSSAYLLEDELQAKMVGKLAHDPELISKLKQVRAENLPMIAQGSILTRSDLAKALTQPVDGHAQLMKSDPAPATSKKQ